MKRRIFYSWQSDRSSRLNRSFIQNAIESALKKIDKDESVILNPILDRDTEGLPGSPDISDSIFEKISLCDVFIADVTIIPSGLFAKRRSPNPNVLIELGYAIPIVGWERIVLIQNTAFGGPENLPFDLRGRRVTTYSFSKGKPVAERSLLAGRIETAIRTALGSTEISSRPGPASPLWFGIWRMRDGSTAGVLEINDVGSNGFIFSLSCLRGSHTGEIEGKAVFVGPHSAYARIEAAESGTCEIEFRRGMKSGIREISLKEAGDCHYFRGMRASFEGVFVHERVSLFDAGALDEIGLMQLYRLTGPHFANIISRFQDIGKVDNDDDFAAEIVTGGVAGLYTITEAIIMSGPTGQMWAAYVDEGNLFYFTTEPEFKCKLPRTIATWQSRFSHINVVFEPASQEVATHS